MSELKSLRKLFDKLIVKNGVADKRIARQRFEQLIQGRADAIGPLSRVLEAEIKLSFFEEGHKQKTIHEKSKFNFQLASLTCQVLEAAIPMYEFPRRDGIFGTYHPDVVSDGVDALNADGYYVFPRRLPDDAIRSLTLALSEVPFQVRTTGEVLENVTADNVHLANGNTIWVIDQQQVLRNWEVQSLVMDPMLLEIVQQYLQCVPIHVQTNCWWTIHRDSKEESLSRDAQKFHQDKAFIRFVKVFVYLNDVTDENGPHTYVAGSAKDYESHVPHGYQVSDRIDDVDLQKAYSADRFKTIMGPAGTIVLEDTSGFHKGEPVISGHRLMLQLEYCCSLYFNPVASFAKLGLTEPFLSFADEYPRTFMNYNDARYFAHQQKMQLGNAEQPRLRIDNRNMGVFSRIRRLLAG